MSKGTDMKKATKKEPTKTLKEKRLAKQAKKGKQRLAEGMKRHNLLWVVPFLFQEFGKCN